MRFDRRVEQHLAEQFPAILGYLSLLPWITMIFKAKNDGVLGCFESTFSDCFDYVPCIDFRYKCISRREIFCVQFCVWNRAYSWYNRFIVKLMIPMNNDRLIKFSVPKVQFNASTTSQKALAIYLHGTLSGQLMSYEIYRVDTENGCEVPARSTRVEDRENYRPVKYVL